MLAGVLAGIGATLANLLLAAVASSLFPIPPGFRPFMTLPILAACLGGSLGASGVFGLLERVSHNPRRSLSLAAITALLVSFALPITLFEPSSSELPEVGWNIIVTLMLMHVIVAWLSG